MAKHVDFRYLAPGTVQSIAMIMSVCLSARITSKTTWPNFTILPEAVARSSSNDVCGTLCTFGFVDDVTFSHVISSVHGASFLGNESVAAETIATITTKFVQRQSDQQV